MVQPPFQCFSPGFPTSTTFTPKVREKNFRVSKKTRLIFLCKNLFFRTLDARHNQHTARLAKGLCRGVTNKIVTIHRRRGQSQTPAEALCPYEQQVRRVAHTKIPHRSQAGPLGSFPHLPPRLSAIPPASRSTSYQLFPRPTPAVFASSSPQWPRRQSPR